MTAFTRDAASCLRGAGRAAGLRRPPGQSVECRTAGQFCYHIAQLSQRSPRGYQDVPARRLNVKTVAVSMGTSRVRATQREIPAALTAAPSRCAAAIVTGVRTSRYCSGTATEGIQKGTRRGGLTVESLLARLWPAILREVGPLHPRRYRANAGGSSSAVVRTQSGLPGPRF